MLSRTNQIPSGAIWADQARERIGSVSAIRNGAGPDVVLLHGVGLRSEAWAGQMTPLRAVARVIAIDMPGHGESPAHRVETLNDVADHVVSALPPRSILIGHSMGAMIAFNLAVRYPDRCRGVVALNAIFERNHEAAHAVRTRAAALDGVVAPDPAPTLNRWFGQQMTPARTACARWLTEIDGAAYKQAYTIFAEEDGPTRFDLQAMSVPALFMTGGDEPNSTPAMSKAMADLAPFGRAVVLQGAAHMMPMTHAAQINEHLLSFLAQCPE